MTLILNRFFSLASLLAALISGSIGVAHAAAAADTQQQNTVTQTNPVAKAAQAAGVVNCVSRIDQMSGFLLANSAGGIHTFFPKQHANDSLLSTSFEVISGGVSSYASASFAPVGNSGCGAVYEAVTYWQNSCEEVAGKAFAQMKRNGTLKSRVQVLEAGTTARVFLMPAGSGCMSVKKEIVY